MEFTETLINLKKWLLNKNQASVITKYQMLNFAIRDETNAITNAIWSFDKIVDVI